ncbi:MAG: endolytic transglycosylase MltG [Bacteroidales bacterium]|nr:endolytic transglycosylase MltG [Bacteroidales bacterium]
MPTRRIVIIIASVLGAALLAIGGVFLYRMWYDRKVSNFSGMQELYVYPDMSVQAVRDSILAGGKVKNPASLLRVFKDVETVQTGHYCIDDGCSSMYVARMLHNGWQTPVNLTLSGSIRTPEILARKVGSQMLADSAAVANFAFSDDSLARFGVDAAHLFTIVIPDTYQILWTASVGEIFQRLSDESDAWWTPERINAARAQGLTRKEACTLASIVAGETRYEPEMPTIAGVYLNRLRTGMRLQADPTIAFCFDYEPKRILKSHLAVDSPYNTYQHTGLPPGPIACPPKSCLEAVLHPQSHNYIFFCADPSFNGSHRFAASYSEHLANARAFQKAMTERQKAEANK